MKYRWILIIFVLGFLLRSTVLCLANGEQNPDTSAQKVSLPVTMTIHKVDGGTQLPVEGAVFVLQKEDGAYLASDTDADEPQWTMHEDKACSLTTDADGTICIYGLLPDVYYLQETEAPDGYILLEEPIKIQLSAEYDTDGKGEPVITSVTAIIDEDEPIVRSNGPHIDITIENTYGTVLPATGGVGMASYYMFGFVILFPLALVIVAKRLIREQ